MKFIDMALPSGTLWAEENQEQLPFSNAISLPLPTEEDFRELLSCCKVSFGEDGMHVEAVNGNVLTFPFEGFQNRAMEPDSPSINDEKERKNWMSLPKYYVPVRDGRGYYRIAGKKGYNGLALFINGDNVAYRAADNSMRLSVRMVYRKRH